MLEAHIREHRRHDVLTSCALASSHASPPPRHTSWAPLTGSTGQWGQSESPGPKKPTAAASRRLFFFCEPRRGVRSRRTEHDI